MDIKETSFREFSSDKACSFNLVNAVMIQIKFVCGIDHGRVKVYACITNIWVLGSGSKMYLDSETCVYFDLFLPSVT